jgi:heme-degrading monooxygenase HmoA
MFVRITSFQFDPSRAEEADSRNDEISQVVRQMPGMLHAYTARDDKGEGIVVGIWESEQAANDAEAMVAQAWSKVGDVLTSQPQRKAYPVVYQLM